MKEKRNTYNKIKNKIKQNQKNSFKFQKKNAPDVKSSKRARVK